MRKMCNNMRLYPNGDSAWKNVKYEDRFRIIEPFEGDKVNWKTGRPVLLEGEEYEWEIDIPEVF